ncbi:alpha/beta fold hydrolase [Pseudomonas aeruginosa]|uniref:alpha/beta fold hydrolase n=1 Tax=Pseudomonas aeruginosa TaxID=287 RepID=UPI00040691D0|nr:alpha/beta hydrolase [Pseudomonas aeruginosa]SST09027.1 alpha/beta hydrolase family protein [Acinetobacter baumannii]ARN47904.1 alpha/beta hydrolase [Pseudomonas aeruginosa]KSP08665.1 alpha/beta hydrolase [Pseudomonas aeruginosa]MBG4096147.1 alpha/beta hydrolase [Pseudomonas aeruginosa]MBG4852805.1 alpha/beta hydrolase [Pseudomonas aeruginosa]
MSRYAFVSTDVLDIAYLEWNPQGARSAVLLHGWPDSPHAWKDLAESLADAGYRVLAPALRGFAPTRFRDASTPRSGQLAALACDLLAFVDSLALQRPLLVGHDWGARAVASACGLREDVASHLVMLSVGYASNDPQQVLSLPQARSFWYQWFMATPRGERALREEGEAFARQMWDTWSPPGWYAERDFQEAAQAFSGPDWVAVVLHYYRHRWGFVAGEPRYGAAEQRLLPAPRLALPTLVLHGGADACTHPDGSRGREHYFSGRYQRLVLEGVGHFPQREAAAQVADAILRFCADD